jgi:hypothetical protein
MPAAMALRSYRHRDVTMSIAIFPHSSPGIFPTGSKREEPYNAKIPIIRRGIEHWQFSDNCQTDPERLAAVG